MSIIQGYIEHRDRLLKLAADNSGAKQKVTLCTFFSNVNDVEAQKKVHHKSGAYCLVNQVSYVLVQFLGSLQ